MGPRISWLEQTSVFNKEWVIADEEIIIRAKNYRSRLRRIWERNGFAEIVNDIRTIYLNYDLKPYMTPKSYEDVDAILTAAENRNEVEKVVEAYTMTNNFHNLVNTHLANLVNMNNVQDIGLDPNAPAMTYWCGPLDFACIFVNHEKLEKYRPEANEIVYRGMTVSQEVVMTYRNGARFMNKTFVSTSKDKEIALCFAGRSPGLVSCLCIYTLRPSIRRTALDISSISAVTDESEILILPYSTFEVTNVVRSNDNIPDSIDFTIELQECHQEIDD
jgi:hypothetical protein